MSGVIMGVDAGPRPGLAIKLDGAYLTMWCFSQAELIGHIHDNKPDWVALELFARSNRIDTNMIATLECVGAVKGICSALGITCYGQRPQERKSFIPDAKPLLRPGHAPHERDALSHLLYREHLLKHGKLNP